MIHDPAGGADDDVGDFQLPDLSVHGRTAVEYRLPDRFFILCVLFHFTADLHRQFAGGA